MLFTSIFQKIETNEICFLVDGNQNSNLNQPQLLVRNTSSLSRSQIAFKDIEVQREIGEGSYGKVFLGKWNAASVAIKFCKKRGNIQEFLNEIQLMMYE
jgi:predicted Ser/Thr protein kinase